MILQKDVFPHAMDILMDARDSAKGMDMPPKPLKHSRQQLLDLIDLLDPIAEATDTLQADGITSSAVIPAILGAYKGNIMYFIEFKTHN